MALIAAALASIAFIAFLVSALAAYRCGLRFVGFKKAIALAISFVVGWGASFGVAVMLNTIDDVTFAAGRVLSRAIGSGFWMALFGTVVGFVVARRKQRAATGPPPAA